ncbi:hypothetical protein CRENBAI_021588 [Crenichthys baileyi]|uniref:Uncharacterized protein n=1 Tax=Crenichthys baileyi TaxID=28760 RepID=A0AAV9SGW0_9TELE
MGSSPSEQVINQIPLPSSTVPGRRRGPGRQQQLLRPSLLRPEELSMESGIDPGQDYYTQDYYNYDQGYDFPQYGSRRRLISPMYDEYGEVIMEDDGNYYSPHGPEGRGRGRGGMRGRGPPKRVAFRDLPAEDQMVQHQPADEGEPSKAAKRLKSVMKLSKLLAASKGGVQPSDAGPPGPSSWKKAKMLKMFGAGKKDKDYAKLMSARRIDSEESLTDRPAVTRPIESKSDARSRLSKVLKRITISNKLKVRRRSQSSVSHGSATGSEKDEEASQTASEDERKSKVSISVTESEPEGGASGSIKEKDSDEESSEKSSVDRDYLKVDLDRDDTNESTVDSEEEPDEEPGDSDEESKSKSEEEEDTEKESGSEKESETERESESEKESVSGKSSATGKESETEKESESDEESRSDKETESGTGTATEKETSTERDSTTERDSDEGSDEEEVSGSTRESGSSTRTSMRSSATEASRGSSASATVSRSGSKGSESASESVSGSVRSGASSSRSSVRSTQRTSSSRVFSEKSSEEISEAESGTGTASDAESGSGSGSERSSSQGSSKKKTSGSDLSKRSSSGSQHSFRSKGSSANTRSTSGSRRSQTSVLSHGSEDTITEESEEEEEEEEGEESDESKDSASKISSESSSRRSSVVSEGPGPSTPYHGQPYSPEIRSTSDETYGGLSPITEVDEDAISSDKSSPGRKKRIKLVVDRENENSSTGEESTTESQQNRLPNSHSSINGNIYLAQNGTIVRTRRPAHLNNLKMGSPCRLSKQFKKLEKLGVTHEEPPPAVGNEVSENNMENGTGSCRHSNKDVNLNTLSSCGPLGSTITNLKTFGSKTSNAKAIIDSGQCVSGDQEASVDSHKNSRDALELHSDHTLSDEEELWMGPWNNLHIPMTKL